MPYCQLTPSLKRCSVVLKTSLCCSNRILKVTYDRKCGLVSFYYSDEPQQHDFQPRVRLIQSDSEIPHQSVTYTAELTLERVLSEPLNKKDGLSESYKRITGPLTVDTHRLGDHSHLSNSSQTLDKDSSNGYISAGDLLNCISSVTGTTSQGKKASNLTPSIYELFGDVTSEDCARCPIADHSDESCIQPFTVGLRDFRIVQHCLEDISVHRRRNGVLLLLWRIRIITEGLIPLDLSLALLWKPEQQLSLSKYSVLSLRCKLCGHVIENLEGVTIVPLPTEFFSCTTGSTFCEECESQLVAKTPSFARSRNVIYQSEEFITIFSPSCNVTEDLALQCNSCGYHIGDHTDNNREFVSYRKSRISALCDDRTDDIFWRFTPLREAIESLQYDKRTKLYILGDNSSAPLMSATGDRVTNSGHTDNTSCIELIKITGAPDTFVTTPKTVLEATRVLWRCVRNPVVDLQIQWHHRIFQGLIEVLTYFSQQGDPKTGYIPSLLVAI